MEETLGVLWINLGIKSTIGDDLQDAQTNLAAFEAASSGLEKKFSSLGSALANGLRGAENIGPGLASSLSNIGSEVENTLGRIEEAGTGLENAFTAVGENVGNRLSGIEQAGLGIGNSLSQIGAGASESLLGLEGPSTTALSSIEHIGTEGASSIRLLGPAITEVNGEIRSIGTEGASSIGLLGAESTEAESSIRRIGTAGVESIGMLGPGTSGLVNDFEDIGSTAGRSLSVINSGLDTTSSKVATFGETTSQSFEGIWGNAIDGADAVDARFSEIGGEGPKQTGRGMSLSSLGSTGQSAGMGLTVGATVPIVAGAAVFTGLAEKAGDFQSQMAYVSTVVPEKNQGMMNQLSQQALEFSDKYGIPISQVTKAMYDNLSAGVPTENLFSEMDTQAKMAVGGNTELGTSVKGLNSIVNAYGRENLDAAHASDVLTTAVHAGYTTHQLMSEALYHVTPIAAGLGVNFENVAAAMATMANQGVPTDVAADQLKNLLVELSQSGSQTAKTFEGLAGKSFKEFMAEIDPATGKTHTLKDALDILGTGVGKAGGDTQKFAKNMIELNNPTSDLSKKFAQLTGQSVQEYLNTIDPATGKTRTYSDVMKVLGIDTGGAAKSVADMFTNQTAMQAALELSGTNSSKLGENIKKMGDSAGQTDKDFEKMEQTVEQKSKEMGTSINTSMIKIGSSLLPIFNDTVLPLISNVADSIAAAAPYIKILADGFNALPGPVKVGAIALITLLAAAGPVLFLVGNMAAGIGALITLFGLVAPVVTAVVGGIGALVGGIALFNPITLAAIAIIAGLYIGFTHWQDITGIVGGVFTFVQSTLQGIWTYITNIDWGSLGTGLIKAFLGAITFGLIGQPIGMITSAMLSVFTFFTGSQINWGTAGKNLVTFFLNGLMLINNLPYQVVFTAINAITTFLSGTNWSTIGSQIIQTFLGGLQSAWVGVTSWVTGQVDALKSTISSVTGGLVGGSSKPAATSTASTASTGTSSTGSSVVVPFKEVPKVASPSTSALSGSSNAGNVVQSVMAQSVQSILPTPAGIVNYVGSGLKSGVGQLTSMFSDSLKGLSNLVPHSLAHEGPLSVAPNWLALFDGIVPAASAAATSMKAGMIAIASPVDTQIKSMQGSALSAEGSFKGLASKLSSNTPSSIAAKAKPSASMSGNTTNYLGGINTTMHNTIQNQADLQSMMKEFTAMLQGQIRSRGVNL